MPDSRKDPHAHGPDRGSLLDARDQAVATAEAAIRETTSLTRLLSVLGDQAPLDVLLDRALSALSELFLADLVVLLDPNGTGRYSPLASVGLPEELADRPMSDAEDGHVHTVLRQGRPLLLAEADQDPALDRHLGELGVRTALWLPLMVEQSARGVLLLARCREAPFAPGDADLLMVMANRIALTLEQSQLHAQYEQIIRAGRAIGCCHLDKYSVHDEVVRNFAPVVGAHAASLVLKREDSTFACVSHSGQSTSWPTTATRLAKRLQSGPEPCSEVHTSIDTTPEGIAPGPPDEPPIRSLLAVPIQLDGVTCAMLFAMRTTATPFTPSALQAARIYAAQASMFMQNAGLYWRVRQELAERTRAEKELKEAKLEAETANRAKADFLANMSHELRTPLNGVLSMLQLMGQQEQDPERALLLKTAQESSWSLLSIINDLLCFVQIEAGRITIAHEPMEPLAVLDNVVRTLETEALGRGLALRMEADPGMPARVLGDANRLRQIVTNLVANALKFTERGEVVVRARALGHDLPDDQRLLLFSVHDTGVGIPDEKLALAFEPFTQVDSSLARRFQGTGIGLGIVHYLVNHMGGTICVESEVDRGSTFHFTIRCGRADEASDAAVAPAQPPDLVGLRVLLVEDDRVNRFAATQFLERLGCIVVPAVDGRQALEAMETDDFDYIFMDVQMPGMDGIETTRAIRRSADRDGKAHTPIIAMTAHALIGDRERFLEAGMDGYLPKPVSMDEMARILAEMRERRSRSDSA